MKAKDQCLMTNDPMSNDQTMKPIEAVASDVSAPHAVSRFDLAERTARFGEAIIRFVGRSRPTLATRPLLSQLVRCATSIGANYGEADDAGSKKEFRFRISLCKREARETQYWLRMLAAALDDSSEVRREA